MSDTPILPTGEAQARRLEAVYEQLVQSLHTPDVAQKLAAQSGTEWSVTEVLGHMVEMIPYWLAACQTILTADTPPHFGRSLDAPERLAGVERGAHTSIQALLALLKPEVQKAAVMLRALTAAQRNKQGIHPTRGAMTVGEIIEGLILTHAEGHLVQIQAML